MLERLIENWLDKAGERSYQRCFCQMLTGQGYRLVHNTQHTPLEFGKDVIAVSPDGKLCGYQLKGNPGGTLKPREFGEIRGQLEQLATLALVIPEFDGQVPEECFLVTNGEIDEAVYHQISALNASLEKRDHPPDKIKTITRGHLLDWSKSLGLSLWPSEMEDFGNLVKLLNYQGNEMFPAKVFDPLLQHTLRFDKYLEAPELRRRITSAAVITAVSLHSFSRRQNYYAEITAWMMFSAYAIAACEKNGHDYRKNCKEAVLTARDAIYDLLSQLCEELKDLPVVVEGDPFSEFAFYRPRLLLVYALMSIYWMWSEKEGWKNEAHKKIIEGAVAPTLPMPFIWGEGAVPNFLTYSWYRKRFDDPLKQDELVAKALSDIITGKLAGKGGLADPYYTAEEVVHHEALRILGGEDPYGGSTFEGISYVCEPLMMCLVQNDRKEICKALWPNFTKIVHEWTAPDQPWQFCLFRFGEDGKNESRIYPSTGEWAALRKMAADCSTPEVPAALRADPILLLLFINIFPFRVLSSVVKLLHQVFDQGDAESSILG